MLRYILKIVGLWFVGVIAFAMLVNNAHAGEFYGVVTIGSYHFGESPYHKNNKNKKNKREEKMNGKNWGLGVEYTEGNWGVAAGFYENSINNTSKYLLGTYSLPVYQDDLSWVQSARLGVALGTVNGYEYKPGEVTRYIPAGNVFLAAGFSNKLGVRLAFIPGKLASKERGQNALGLQAAYKFW